MSSATSVSTVEDLPPRAAGAPAACFSIAAHRDPGVLPRVIELFAKRGLVPDLCRATRDGDMLAIELEIDGMAADLADYIGRCLRQIHLVDCVLTSTRERTARVPA